MDFKLLALVFLLITGLNCEDEAASEASEVDSTIVLGDSDFEDVIKTNNFFVMFFAPW